MGKWLIRLAAFPAVILLTILKWIGMYILSFSEMICRLVGGISLVLAVAAYLIGIATVKQAVYVLIAGFILYLIPRVGRMLVTSIAFLHIALMEVIKK